MAYARSTIEQRISDNDLSKRDIPSFIEPLPPLISNPFMRPKPVKGTNLLELFEEDSDCEDHDLLQVYLRIKPCNAPSNLYEVRSEKCLVTSMDMATAGHGRRTQHSVNKMYTFSRIFGPESTQKEIFENVVKDNLRKLPDGYNYTLLTYGASGSGKTFTLMGTVASPGLVPRSLEYLFKIVDAAQQPLYKPSEGGAEKLSAAVQEYELQRMNQIQRVSAPLRDKYRRMSTQLHADFSASTCSLANRTKYYIWVSFVEIYNEAVYDLLATSDRQAGVKLRIREDASGHVFVKDATQAFVRSGSEAYDALVAGKLRRQVAATGVHAHSSRSHCIFTITLLTSAEGSHPRTSYLRLCDLAGAERAARTRNTGARLHESRAINSSLHALERALRVLRNVRRPGHLLVPTRESKLTRLLGAGLSGKGGESVSMVVTMNPSAEDAQETRHVLQLAAVAKDIQVNSTLAESTTFESIQDTTVATSAEVMKLRADIERLHFELAQAESRNKKLLASLETKQQKSAATMFELVKETKDSMRLFYEGQITSLKEKHRYEIEELTEEYKNKLRGVETPSKSRDLQVLVTRLQTELALLEEKLNAERLARARAEQEVQHLRACIDERDEKGSEDSEETEVVLLSDDEQESDDEMNQSLEPSFRKGETLNNISEDVGENSNNEDSSDNGTTLNHDTTLNNASDRKSSFIEKSQGCTDVSSETAHDTYYSDKDGTSSNFADISLVSSNVEVSEAKNESKTKVDLKRGTYVVKDVELNASVDSGCNFSNNKESKDSLSKDNDDSVNISFEGKHIGRVTKTSLNKLKLSTVSNSVNRNESLALFEQFEKEVRIPPQAPKHHGDDSMKFIVLKEKKKYFESIDKFKKLPEQSSENSTLEIKAKKTYFDDNDGDMPEKIDVDNKRSNYHIDHNSTDKNEFLNVKDIPRINTDKQKSPESGATATNLEEFGEIKMLKEKRTYFDNISENIDVPNTNVNEIVNTSVKVDDLRSPSIVKDEIPKDYEPTTIKKLLGDSRNSNAATSLKNKVINNLHESLDIFDEIHSPRSEIGMMKNMETIEKSLKKISILQGSHENGIQEETEVITTHLQNKDIFKVPEAFKINQDKEIILSKSKNTNFGNDTDIEFENIFNDVSSSRTTDFDLLLTRELNNTDLLCENNVNKHKIPREETSVENHSSNPEPDFLVIEDSQDKNKAKTNKDSILAHAIENSSRSLSNEEDDKTVRYNLRHKNTSEIKDTESYPKSTLKAKRSLRLKRHQNQELDDEVEKNTEKLKDILNLQQDFADVMMDMPVTTKIVKDIPSPERLEEDENVAPIMGIQSCPSKSITRSRRKLFTPRAEPLEEPLNQTGDSNERIYVPRPSYHRGRARRKL